MLTLSSSSVLAAGRSASAPAPGAGRPALDEEAVAAAAAHPEAGAGRDPGRTAEERRVGALMAGGPERTCGGQVLPQARPGPAADRLPHGHEGVGEGAPAGAGAMAPP